VAEEDPEFAALFEAEFSSVAREVYLVCHDLGRAEDITQDAFVQLLRHWRRVARYDRPGAWVRRVAIRAALRSVHREARRRPLERRAAGPAPSDQPFEDHELLSVVRSLPPQQRAAVALFYYEDLPIGDVATVLGCSAATARVHLHKARRALRERVSRLEENS
jgi:RNA polymerase sigma factor (sigma-70 family)